MKVYAEKKLIKCKNCGETNIVFTSDIGHKDHPYIEKYCSWECEEEHDPRTAHERFLQWEKEKQNKNEYSEDRRIER